MGSCVHGWAHLEHDELLASNTPDLLGTHIASSSGIAQGTLGGGIGLVCVVASGSGDVLRGSSEPIPELVLGRAGDGEGASLATVALVVDPPISSRPLPVASKVNF